jgi:CheY-like chemotaxis protein
MTGASRDADGVLAAAAADFVAATRVALAECETAATRLGAAPDDAAALDVVRRCVHRLNGSAGTFGFARAGRMAAAMEAVARRWLADPALDRDRRGDIVATFVAAARALFDAAAVSPRAPVRPLWLLDVRDKLAARVAAEAAAHGYLAERVARDELEEALADEVPHAIVAFVPAPDHPRLGSVLVVELVPGDDAGPRLVARTEAASDAPQARVGVDAGAVAVLDALAALEAARGDLAATALILDDDPVVRAVIGVATTGAGLTPVLTAHVGAFREALAARRPALMVVDVEVGDSSGLDLVAEVRRRPDCAGIPILILSGRDDPATREAADRAGASAFLVKPVDVAALAVTLATWRARAAS